MDIRVRVLVLATLAVGARAVAQAPTSEAIGERAHSSPPPGLQDEVRQAGATSNLSTGLVAVGKGHPAAAVFLLSRLHIRRLDPGRVARDRMAGAGNFWGGRGSPAHRGVVSARANR